MITEGVRKLRFYFQLCGCQQLLGKPGGGVRGVSTLESALWEGAGT